MTHQMQQKQYMASDIARTFENEQKIATEHSKNPALFEAKIIEYVKTFSEMSHDPRFYQSTEKMVDQIYPKGKPFLFDEALPYAKIELISTYCPNVASDIPYITPDSNITEKDGFEIKDTLNLFEYTRQAADFLGFRSDALNGPFMTALGEFCLAWADLTSQIDVHRAEPLYDSALRAFEFSDKKILGKDFIQSQRVKNLEQVNYLEACYARAAE